MNSKKIIGRKEIAHFPEFGLKNIDVKIDTGAYTSSIHCHQIEEEVFEGKKVLCFKLLDPKHKQYNNKIITSKNYRQKVIRSSTGHASKRYIIKTVIELFGQQYPIDLSLSERDSMKYPVLIGRKLLSGKFIVDTAKINLTRFSEKK
ncbi:MAG: RimK/LysX family protein [Prolixibacteraceae bacterium]|jgi:hypothetical protein|nr:RimK/LysX family protein [Prolixibacteraceae bacterium]